MTCPTDSAPGLGSLLLTSSYNNLAEIAAPVRTSSPLGSGNEEILTHITISEVPSAVLRLQAMTRNADRGKMHNWAINRWVMLQLGTVGWKS
jgi:hypothetical protein